MNTFSTKKSGFTLIEILIACSIMTIATFALLSSAQKGIELSSQALRQTQANFLLEEGAEAVKTIRDAGWSNISSVTDGTTYYLFFDASSNTWSLTPTPLAPIDSVFTRTVTLQTANRDADNSIASTGTADDGTKKVTVTVSWPSSGGLVSENLSFYIADIFD